jgi:UDP-N-acetylmuramate dehydrogenase
MPANAGSLHDRIGPKLKENVVIREHVATAVGGIVDFLVICETLEEIVAAVKAARELEIPYIVIGQGSNVLFSDIGYAGLVIVNRTINISYFIDKSQIIADSGVLLSRVIMEAATHDLTGLEFLFGLRGSIGGATVNNRQANGVAMSKLVKAVTVLMPDGKIVHHKAAWLDYSDRSSKIMKQRQADRDQPLPVLLTVTLQLSRNKKEEILRKIQHFGALNREMWPLEEPSIGPVFRDLSAEQSADAYLQTLQLRKTKIGRARIFPRQFNFILTHERGLGPGTTADIYKLVTIMKEKVLEAYGQILEEAFEYVGTWNIQQPANPQDLIEYE